MTEAADKANPDGAGGPIEGQVACSMTSTLLRATRNGWGNGKVEELIRVAGVEHSMGFLEDVGNWIWYDDAVRLFEAAEQVLGDEHIGRRVGEETVRQHAGTAVATLLRSLGSPQAIFEQITQAVAKFSTVTDMRTVELGPGRAVVRAEARQGFRRHRHMCEYAIGILSQPPCLFGLGLAHVEETCCELRGDDHCLYTVSWDAEAAEHAADPHALVTALEAQLAAMTERLESMYATARDLIASDDLDAALARITDRAATAVRAPTYLLAVRAGEDLYVHHRGLTGEDPREVAEALLERASPKSPDDGSESRLIAEVASASKSYGRLMAAFPAGAAFFPHERELLEVYARYAAAVLDTATALDDARRRHEQSRALLGLAQALASASTREDVAQRLVDAVPAVVDCDRVTVFLWNEGERRLRCTAAAGLPPAVERELRALRIDPRQSPELASAVADPSPEPVLFDRGSEEIFVARLMRQVEAVATVAVPIVGGDRFYGVLDVSVVERPERLRLTRVLRDSLTGVAAQTATALDNARLIETMAHQARHDNLTGLPGHRAFHEALAEATAGGAQEGVFTLAMVDIDDFKQINDEHGHPFGDRALCSVAANLRATVREPDTVFRVGGEEFAVLMPGLSSRDALPVAERLRAAVADAGFALPVRVSVGLASWPDDADERHALLERADAALYAAKRAGKDRAVAAAAAA